MTALPGTPARQYTGVPMIPHLKRLAAVPVAAAAAACGALFAAAHDPVKPNKPFGADQAYVREHYTKYGYQIPMRGGVRLFMIVYAPQRQLDAVPAAGGARA